MQRKIVLPKNAFSGGRSSHVKILMWSGIALVILVLATPLLMRQKSSRVIKPIPDRLTSERGNMLVKAIPKPPEAMSVSGAPSDPSRIGGSIASGYDSRLGFGRRSEPGSEPPPAKTAEVRPPAAPSPAETKDKPAAPAPPEPKEQTASVAPPAPPPAHAQPAPAEQKTASVKAQPKKASATGGKLMYAVQVGSFREKKNAADVQRNLKKKGYEAVLKPTAHPSMGLLYIVQLQPVEDLSKASTLMEQVRHENQVKPILVRTGP